MIKRLIEDLCSPKFSFWDKLCFGIIILMVVILKATLGLVVFRLIDSADVTPSQTALVVVESRWVEPAHTKTSFGWIHIHRPTKYYLRVQIQDKLVSMSVGEWFFARVSLGTKIRVEYRVKWISGSYDPLSVELIPDQQTSGSVPPTAPP